MKAKLKALAAWSWTWITIIAAQLLLVLPALIGYLDQAAALNIAAFLPPEHAAAIVAGVASLKWAAQFALWVAGLIAKWREAA